MDVQKSYVQTTAAIVSAGFSAALVVATAWIAIATLRGVRAQMHVLTFTEYTRRYAEIASALPWDAASPSCSVEPAKMPEQEREQLLRTMRRYFNICWEELHLHRTAKIDDATWKIWDAGIQDSLRSGCFRSSWVLLRSEYDYGGLGHEFVEFIDARAGATAVTPPDDAAKGLSSR